MIHSSMTCYTSGFGLGHLPIPLAFGDDPLLYDRDGKPINRLILKTMRALSSTLSSNHTTAQIHSDKEERCRTCSSQLRDHIDHSHKRTLTGTLLRSRSLEQESTKDGPCGTVTQVELPNWRQSTYRSQANRSRSTDNQRTTSLVKS
jgi:hypothetical protein